MTRNIQKNYYINIIWVNLHLKASVVIHVHSDNSLMKLASAAYSAIFNNINDPGFSFVRVVEHTNFVSSEDYKDTHIVYLLRYLFSDDQMWTFSDDEYLNYFLNS